MSTIELIHFISGAPDNFTYEFDYDAKLYNWIEACKNVFEWEAIGTDLNGNPVKREWEPYLKTSKDGCFIKQYR